MKPMCDYLQITFVIYFSQTISNDFPCLSTFCKESASSLSHGAERRQAWPTPSRTPLEDLPARWLQWDHCSRAGHGPQMGVAETRGETGEGRSPKESLADPDQLRMGAQVHLPDISSKCIQGTQWQGTADGIYLLRNRLKDPSLNGNGDTGSYPNPDVTLGSTGGKKQLEWELDFYLTEYLSPKKPQNLEESKTFLQASLSHSSTT